MNSPNNPRPTFPLSIVFVGGGNMAQAMIAGLLQSEDLPEGSIQVIEPDEANRRKLTAHHGDKLTVVASCEALGWLLVDGQGSAPKATLPDWVVLAVKPQQAQEALRPLAAMHARLVAPVHLLSIAAGVTVQSLQAWSGLQAVVRTMPNTPAMVGQGITGAYAVPTLSAAAHQQADQILRCLGTVVWLASEDLLDAVTAVSGSGPAYVFYFLECFAAAGEKLGLSPDESGLLALQTINGAMALLAQSGETPASLRAKVTSKGGTTAAALGVLQSDPGGLATLMHKALLAAHHRARELSRQ